MKSKSYFISALLFLFFQSVKGQDSPVWTRHISSPSDTAMVFPVKTLTDGSNHVYVLSTYYKNSGGGAFTNNIWLTKYDNTGAVVWTFVFPGGFGMPRGFDMAVDMNGNCYIAGGFMVSANFEPLVMKVSTAGNSVWVRDSTISFNTGYYSEVILKNNLLYLQSSNGVAVFDLYGNEKWSHSVYAQRIAVDNKGQMIASVSISGNQTVFRYDSSGVLNFSDSTISSRRIATDIDNSFYLLTDYGLNGYELVKYDSSGIFQWNKDTFPLQPGFGDIGFEVLVDYNQDVILVGLNDTMFKFSSSGNLVWEKPMNGLDSYLLTAKITGNNFIAVAGSVYSPSGYDMKVTFFDLNGNQSWQGFYDAIPGGGQEYTVDMDIDYNSGVYVVENTVDSTTVVKFTGPFLSAIDYSLVCVDSVWYDPLDSTFINVQVFNGNAGSMNYPSVQIVSPLGDTIGNPSNWVQFFAQIGNTYTIYHDTITTSGIPDFSNYTFLISEGFGDTTAVIGMCNAVSVPDLSVTQLHLYPNPVHDELYIPTHNKNVHAEIYNAIGKKVFEKELEARPVQVIDVSVFANGIYFLRLYDGIHLYSGKLVKQ
jgi:hypothetical protein